MMNEHDVIELLKTIKSIDVEFLIGGGWGVDALIGKQTRPHSDIDIYIEKRNAEAVTALLSAIGYGETETNFTTQDHTVWEDTGGRVVDLHLIEFGEAGKLYFEKTEYSANIFDGIGQIGEITVRCLTAEAQILFHQGYEHGEKDKQDVLLLCKKYGIPVPAQYKD